MKWNKKKFKLKRKELLLLVTHSLGFISHMKWNAFNVPVKRKRKDILSTKFKKKK